MLIYVDEYYKNLYEDKKKINILLVKETITYLYKNINYLNKNINYKLPEKIIYLVIYLIKHNHKKNIIHKIIKKLLFKISYRISKLKIKYTQNKWIRILNISINNNVKDEILKYFFELYENYLELENNSDNTMNKKNFFIIQTKHLLKLNIKNKRHLYKFLKLNIYDTFFYIDLIFSRLSIIYLSFNYIFDIETKS